MNGCEYVVVNRCGDIVRSSGSPLNNVVIRSCAKPFQMLPVCLLGLDKEYELTPKELAILSSSLLAQSNQVEVLMGLLRKTKISLSDLHLEPSAPAGRKSYQNWIHRNGKKSVLFHPCVGNHIAMYMIERWLTGRGEYYLISDSATQRLIYRIICDFSDTTDIIIGRDGCGAPSYGMPLAALAAMYRKLCIAMEGENPTLCHYSKAIHRLRHAFHKCPVYLEGDGCLSTILTGYHGIVAKTGANGTLAIGIDNLNLGIAVSSPQRDWCMVARITKELLSSLSYGDARLYCLLESV